MAMKLNQHLYNSFNTENIVKVRFIAGLLYQTVLVYQINWKLSAHFLVFEWNYEWLGKLCDRSREGYNLVWKRQTD